MRHRHHFIIVAHFEHQSHTDFRMELNVTVEEPIAGIVGLEAYDRVAAIGHGDRVLDRRIDQVAPEQLKLIQLLDLQWE